MLFGSGGCCIRDKKSWLQHPMFGYPVSFDSEAAR